LIRTILLSRALVAGGLLLGFVSLLTPCVRASSLTICPSGGTSFHICATYDSSITGNAQATTIEATINTAITQIESRFYDPITVNISFDDPTVSGKFALNGDVGANQTSSYVIGYAAFMQALTQDERSPNDIAAVANLPASVPGSTILIKSANALALGITIPNTTLPDGNVYLDIPGMNLSRNTTPTSGQYDLQTVAMHEIDEVLGLGSTLGQPFPSPFNTYLSPEDLFRYDANGQRSFAVGTAAWFEITPGTNLAQFNDAAGLDFGDWKNVGGTVRIQDATGTPGVAGQVGYSAAELAALDVIGFDAAPEPSTWMLFVTGITVCGLWKRSRG
jgi:hypothetical protein